VGDENSWTSAVAGRQGEPADHRPAIGLVLDVGHCRHGGGVSRTPHAELCRSAHPNGIAGRLGSNDAAAVERLLEATNTFDVLAAWVAHAYHQRGWPALSADPGRLRRVDPALDIDLLCGKGPTAISHGYLDLRRSGSCMTGDVNSLTVRAMSDDNLRVR
jgi:hypothetical protein